MNVSETVDFLEQFDRLRPAYLDWRTKAAQRLAAEHGSDAASESHEMIAAVARGLDDISTDEAADVLTMLESGKVETPIFSELVAFVRSNVTANRNGRIENQRWSHDDREPRFECADCRDSGVVEVFNPEFVRELRVAWMESGGKLTGATFDQPQRQFYGAAYSFWQPQRRGPLVHVALCDCSCPRRQRLDAELQSFEAGTRKDSRGKPAGPPACGRYRLKRNQTPIIFNRWHPEIDLDKFYRTY